MKLRLLKGKRKERERKKKEKKIQPKKENNLRDGESNCDFGLELNCSHRNGVRLTPGLPRLARLTSGNHDH
jgi:hypothetical protein